MAFAAAQLAKIEFVLEVARKDPQTFLPDLLEDPVKALRQSGIDLSHGETLAVVDIIEGTSWSPLASRLEKLRGHWKAIRADNPLPKGRGRPKHEPEG
jgi:hypothetical protein